MQPQILGIIVHIKLLFRKASTSSHCYSEIFSLNHKMILFSRNVHNYAYSLFSAFVSLQFISTNHCPRYQT